MVIGNPFPVYPYPTAALVSSQANRAPEKKPLWAVAVISRAAQIPRDGRDSERPAVSPRRVSCGGKRHRNFFVFPPASVFAGKLGVILEGGSPTMANLDWSQCPGVESIPGKRSGAWVFKDTRMPVSTVFENLESGASIEEIMEWFDVTREQIVAVLEFAARSLDAPPSADRSLTSVDAHSL
jgi:uncharacterized protein (DUF433 family)